MISGDDTIVILTHYRLLTLIKQSFRVMPSHKPAAIAMAVKISRSAVSIENGQPAHNHFGRFHGDEFRR